MTSTASEVSNARTTVSREPAPDRRWSRGALRDITLLLLGGLVALGGDTWRDARQRDKRVTSTLASIRAELETNAELVANARAHHLRVVDTLRYYSDHNTVPDSTVYLGGVFNPSQLTSTAWQSARETGVLADIDYRIVLAIAPAYENQERYRALGESVTQSIMIDMRRDGVTAIFRDRFARFIPLAVDFANRERVLADKYRATLAQLDSLTR